MDTKIATASPEQKKELKTARDALDITLVGRATIESAFIHAFGLNELMLQSLQEKYSNHRQENRYNDQLLHHDDLNEIKLQFSQTFDRMLNECEKSPKDRASEIFK